MTTVFVTGATGRMGGEIARQLVPQGARVLAGVRDPARARLPQGVEARRFDFQDPASFAALAGAERLFLMLPPGSGAQQVMAVADAAQAQGLRQVVFLSILGAQKLGFVPHRAIERHLEASGLDWVFLRASYFMQNLATTHRDDIRLRDEIFLPAGRGRTSFVDVRDVAAAGVKALLEGQRSRAYDLTGDVALDYEQVADIFSVTLGRRIHYVNPSPLRFVRTEVARGVPLGFALFMLAEYSVAKLGLAAKVTPELRELLGRPATSFRQFAEDERAVWLRP